MRQGDQQAASELVRRYEPAIRRAVRFRLTDPALRRTCDSMDVCQSVLASFFVRATSGEYELDNPEQLLKLLVSMARHKLASQVRHQQAERRDNRRVISVDQQENALLDPAASPSWHASSKELLEEVQRRLSPEERQLVDLRNEGHDWATIAAQLGSNAVVLRKKLSRALDRVSQELHLED